MKALAVILAIIMVVGGGAVCFYFLINRQEETKTEEVTSPENNTSQTQSKETLEPAATPDSDTAKQPEPNTDTTNKASEPTNPIPVVIPLKPGQSTAAARQGVSTSRVVSTFKEIKTRQVKPKFPIEGSGKATGYLRDGRPIRKVVNVSNNTQNDTVTTGTSN